MNVAIASCCEDCVVVCSGWRPLSTRVIDCVSSSMKFAEVVVEHADRGSAEVVADVHPGRRCDDRVVEDDPLRVTVQRRQEDAAAHTARVREGAVVAASGPRR